MSEASELKRAKVDSLINAFSQFGYKPNDKISVNELQRFLNSRTSTGNFDPILSEKLFQVLNLDPMSTISVSDFVNEYLQFEEEIKKNAEQFNKNLNHEQENHSNLLEEFHKYKTEKLNSEGMSENAKIFGEITDIDIKKKLEGIKEIIIIIIYNKDSKEIHFKIGDIHSSKLKHQSFKFKPISRKDHFEFIMKGVNDKNRIFDIGSKVFPLNDVNSHEEYFINIVVPEIDNDQEVAAYIHAKIVLFWNNDKYYEEQIRKGEIKLKKLTLAANKAADYLKKVREIFGKLTRKKVPLIVDFNNEIKRKVHKVKVAHYNNEINNTNMIEQPAPGKNYLVEFNNLKQNIIVPYKVEFNNTKESFKPGQATNDENNNLENENEYYEQYEQNEINDEEQNIENNFSPNENNQNHIIQENELNIQSNLNPISNMNKTNENVNKGQFQINNQQIFSKINPPIINGIKINKPIENILNQQQIINSPNGQQWLTNQNILVQQNQIGNASNPNAGQINYQMEQKVNINDLVSQSPNTEIEGKDFASVIRLNKGKNDIVGQNGEEYTMAETIGYGASDTLGRVNSYKTGGLEVIDNNNIEDFNNFKDIVQDTKFQNTFSSAIVNNVVNKTLFSENTLPVKVLPEKVNEVIFDNNVQSLPLIYGGKKVVYQNYNEPSNLYQNTGFNQGFNYLQQNYISNMY